MPGLLPLREQIALKVQKCLNVDVDPASEVTIGVGATEMIFDTVAAFVWPDDEVILMEPCYDCYRPAVDTVGGKCVIYKMPPPAFKINWDEVGKLITAKTRMIFISTPNNPTGTILTDHDLQQLANLVRDTEILILSDEVYEHMVYDRQRHCSPLQHPELRQRTFAVYSFGKTYHVTGWRVGYCIAPPTLTAEMRKVHQNVVFGVSHPLQKAIALHLQQSDDYLQLANLFEQKRDLFLQTTQGSRFKPLPCQGSYFQLFDYSAISQQDDLSFCEWLVREHGVAAIPVSRLYTDFTDHKLIRFCFAKTNNTLHQAGERLCRV